VKSGRLRAIAVTGDKRLPSLPDVPTVMPKLRPACANSRISRARSPTASSRRAARPMRSCNELAAQMLKVAGEKEFQSRLDVEGAVPLLGGPAEYAALIARESAKWAAIVKSSGAVVE
jgi:tripartite-type tricarboxylate transporter receptor subunit TctC